MKFIFSTQKSGMLSYLAFAISISIIVLLYRMAIRFRENEGGGSIEYGQAFSFIFRIYLYGAIISSLVMLIYTKFIDTVLLDMLLDQNLKMYETFKLKVDDSLYNTFNNIYKPAPYALVNVFGSTIVGTFWGLILAAFVKKEKSIFDEK